MSVTPESVSTPPEDEVRETGTDRTADVAVIERRSRAAVQKRWEAYADIPWRDPDVRVDPNDPRWILPPIDRLGATGWYRAQPEHVQAQRGAEPRAWVTEICDLAAELGMIDEVSQRVRYALGIWDRPTVRCPGAAR